MASYTEFSVNIWIEKEMIQDHTNCDVVNKLRIALSQRFSGECDVYFESTYNGEQYAVRMNSDSSAVIQAVVDQVKAFADGFLYTEDQLDLGV